ncbi:MAG: polymer-forming cytoskeletal protein [Myxococcota bacterium]
MAAEPFAENVTDAPTPGYIGPELTVRGHLTGEGDVVVDGSFEGEMTFQGRLVIGGSGRVRAPISATAVSVAGQLEGNVEAGEVLVRDGGHLLGDVRAPRVGLEDGGALLGTVEMDVDLPDFES